MKLMHSLGFALAMTATLAVAQEQRGETKATLASKSVSVEYGRPVLAGRDMLGMAKAGTPWRMGAGSPTTLKTDAELTFGKTILAKGTYTLTAVKDEKGDWTAIATDPTSKAEAGRMPLVSTVLKTPVEQFTIEVTGKGNAGEFAMMWGTAKMAAPFTAK